MEQRTNQLMKLESENKLLKIDITKLNKESNVLKSKNDELFNKYEELKIKYKNNESRIRNLEESKNEEIRILETKLKEFEDNYINNVNSNMNNSVLSNQSKISQLTKDKIEELFNIIQSKFPMIQSRIMEKEKKEIEERKQINSIVDMKINKIVNDFSSLKDQFKSKENILLRKQIEELKD